MNLFDPARQRTMSDMPQLAQSVDAVPILYIDPVSPTEVELSAWVRTKDGTGFVSRSYAMELTELGAFMAEFIANPEQVLAQCFDWTAHTTPVRKERDVSDALGKPRKAPSSDGVAVDVMEDEL